MRSIFVLVIVALVQSVSIAHPTVSISSMFTLSEQDITNSLAKLDEITAYLKKSEGPKYTEFRGSSGGGVSLSGNREAFCQNRPRLKDLKPTVVRTEECRIQKKTTSKEADVDFQFSFSFSREHLQSLKAALEQGDAETNVQLTFESLSLLTGMQNKSDSSAKCHSIKNDGVTRKFCDIKVEVTIPESPDA